MADAPKSLTELHLRKAANGGWFITDYRDHGMICEQYAFTSPADMLAALPEMIGYEANTAKKASAYTLKGAGGGVEGSGDEASIANAHMKPLASKEAVETFTFYDPMPEWTPTAHIRNALDDDRPFVVMRKWVCSDGREEWRQVRDETEGGK